MGLQRVRHDWATFTFTFLKNLTTSWKIQETKYPVTIRSDQIIRSVVSESLRPHGLYSPWNSPGQNTGVSRLSLLQGIFPTHRSNPGLPHFRQILYQLSYKGSPRILEWVACPFSRGSSWHRNRIVVSCIAGIFFTNWAIREALIYGRTVHTIF